MSSKSAKGKNGLKPEPHSKRTKKPASIRVGGAKCETRFFIQSFKKEGIGNDSVPKVEFFAGFVNDVDDVGRCGETQCWAVETWVDSAEDAIGFDSYCEAKAWYDNICGSCIDCSIVLHGKAGIRGADGSSWFPLKEFYSENF